MQNTASIQRRNGKQIEQPQQQAGSRQQEQPFRRMGQREHHTCRQQIHQRPRQGNEYFFQTAFAAAVQTQLCPQKRQAEPIHWNPQRQAHQQMPPFVQQSSGQTERQQRTTAKIQQCGGSEQHTGGTGKAPQAEAVGVQDGGRDSGSSSVIGSGAKTVTHQLPTAPIMSSPESSFSPSWEKAA